jgi:hypothetical protein
VEQIFGVDLSTPVKFVIAFGVVLSLIAITFVGLRRLAGRRLPLSNSGRARQPRLGVLDAFAIDARRRLVLIRRDNVEHLIMIGGPNDVLVESEIVRAPAQAQLAPQRAQRAPAENTRAAVAAPERNVARALPPPEQAHAPIQQQQREPEPQPITPAAFRNAFPPRPAARPAPPVADNPPPPPPRAPARPQRMDTEYAEREAAPPARPKAEIDPLYADIERKLGEALSRPASAPPTPPAPTRSAPPPPMRASAPPPPPARPAAPPPPPPPRRAPEPPAPKAGRNHLDALEDEMASLLGRDRAT